MESKRPEFTAKIINAGTNLSQAKLLLLQAAIAAPSNEQAVRLRNIASVSAELVHQLQSIARASEPPSLTGRLSKKTNGVG